jgi:hypothetical protein
MSICSMLALEMPASQIFPAASSSASAPADSS